MGATHFLTKGLERVKTEMSLHVLAYNVKRLMSLLGVAGMMEAIRVYAFLSALQRVFRAITLLIRSVSPKTRHCTLSTLKCRASAGTVLPPRPASKFLHSLGRKRSPGPERRYGCYALSFTSALFPFSICEPNSEDMTLISVELIRLKPLKLFATDERLNLTIARRAHRKRRKPKLRP